MKTMPPFPTHPQHSKARREQAGRRREHGSTSFVPVHFYIYFSADYRSPRNSRVCAGLGARNLSGVDMYPIRGQTVLLRALWLRYWVLKGVKYSSTYLIPRDVETCVLSDP